MTDAHRTEPPTRETPADGLSLAPLRALRPVADGRTLGSMLCPPYDVIDAGTRRRLLDANPDNAVAVILPEPTPDGYAQAADRLAGWVRDGVYRVEDSARLFVYEMSDGAGRATRGLLGAVELRDPDDGVILPHENTMAGPVADRLEVMTATGADLEPIYLVYDGGGAASEVVGAAGQGDPVADTQTPDGVRHRLWAVDDEQAQRAVALDLGSRRALIADGHHRYATYRERQRRQRAATGSGPWDRGLALLVDTSEYGPQVHAIHRVLPGLGLDDAVPRLDDVGRTIELPLAAALAEAERVEGFAAVLTDGSRTLLLTDPDGALAAAAQRPGDVAALANLDVTIVHRALVERVWRLTDDVETVGYAHSVDEAIHAAGHGFALLLRPTPVDAVAAVAAAGARMPRKSTLFTPKPASGLVMRRLCDQG